MNKFFYKFLLKFLQTIHIGVVIACFTGWIWLPQDFMKYGLTMCVLVLYQWLILDGYCVLTLLENYTGSRVNYNKGMFESLLEKCIPFGVDSDESVKKIVNKIAATSMLLNSFIYLSYF